MQKYPEPIVLSDWSKVPSHYTDQFYNLQIRSSKFEIQTFGLHYYNDALWTGPYVGVATTECLKSHGILEDRRAIVIQPRFELDPWQMLNEVFEDDEFSIYLDDSEKGSTPLFHLYTSERPIAVPQHIADSGEILLYLCFLNACYRLCRKGLKRSMGKSSKNYSSRIRGKINIKRNMQLNTMNGRNDRFYCEFPNFTEDNLENRILKSALNKVSKPLKDSLHFNPEIEKRVRYCVNMLRHVTEITISSNDFRTASAAGFYSYYKQSLLLAESVLKDRFSVPETSNSGEQKPMMVVTPYMINMQLLFELFCRARLKKTLPGSLELAPYKTAFPVRDRGANVRNLHLSQQLIPDLIIRRRMDKSVVALFDAKYKESSLASRDDTLQLLAYSLASAADLVGFMFPSNSTLNENFDKRVTLRSPFVNNGIPYVEYPVGTNLYWREDILR